jgi:WD40 repeat protein
MNLRVGAKAGLLVLLVLGLQGRAEQDKMRYPGHLQPFLLGKSGKILVQKRGDTLATCSLQDGKLIHTFRMHRGFSQYDVSADERWLVGCNSGDVRVWNLQTGQQLWHQDQGQSSIGWSCDVSFSWDGLSFVVCGNRDLFASFAVVFDTRTGRWIRAISSPPGETFWSAALSPDGAKGVLVGLRRQLHSFDVNTRALKNLKVEAEGPIRYSAADGNSILCHTHNPQTGDFRLRLVNLKDPPSWKEMEDFQPNRSDRRRMGAFLSVGHSTIERTSKLRISD